jgi:hypothetical protein
MLTKLQSNLVHTFSVNLYQDFITDWVNQFNQLKNLRRNQPIL